MTELPVGIETGERARLFPVLSETSKEGRTTSAFLACLANVREYGTVLLSSLGQRVGKTARIESFTEIGFQARQGESKLRPDGLILLTVGSRSWSVIVESKIGGSELTAEQIDGYLDLAQRHGIDAVVTISNDFTASPEHHPIPTRARRNSKVQLFHWSWMYVLTEADLLLSNQDVLDNDQHYLLSELARFLTHQSAGVKGFDAMPSEWSEMAQMVRAGGVIKPNAPETQKVVGAWHQEVRDLSLILSRQVGVQVTNKLPRALISDSAARLKADAARLSSDKKLYACLAVPGAAGPVEIYADLGLRTVTASVKVDAPQDKQSTKARVNWLLRQLQKATADNLHMRLYWPSRSQHTQHSFTELRSDVSIAQKTHPKLQVRSFEVCLVRQLGARFAQSRNFIKELEELVPDFYEHIVQHMKAWQPPPPQMREGRTEASNVTPEALSEDLRESRESNTAESHSNTTHSAPHIPLTDGWDAS